MEKGMYLRTADRELSLKDCVIKFVVYLHIFATIDLELSQKLCEERGQKTM